MSDLFPQIININGELFVITWRHVMVYGTLYVFMVVITILAMAAGYRSGVREGHRQAESIWERDCGVKCGEAKALTATIADILKAKRSVNQ